MSFIPFSLASSSSFFSFFPADDAAAVDEGRLPRRLDVVSEGEANFEEGTNELGSEEEEARGGEGEYVVEMSMVGGDEGEASIVATEEFVYKLFSHPFEICWKKNTVKQTPASAKRPRTTRSTKRTQPQRAIALTKRNANRFVFR